MKVQRNLSPLLAAGLCALALAAVSATPAQAQVFTPVEMDTNWLRFASPITNTTNSDAWNPSGAVLEYTTNAGQTLASNFIVSPTYIFSARIQPFGTDNDRLGLVFDFTDAANNYRFSWEGGGFADNGLSGLNLIRESGGVSSSLFTQATNWAANTSYDVTITRTGSNIGLQVQRVSDSVIIANTTVSDSTFSSGRIGLFTDSQTTRFSNVTLAVPNAAAPEPGTLALLGGAALIGSAGIVARRRKAGSRS